jgi:pimeloyl-ACP methyl ester carboxylesterase
MQGKTPLILFPGMGADERLFEPQRREFPQIVVPAWIEPRRGESLGEYGARLAGQVDLGAECFVGGASFGGFVAIEVARHLRAKACFLIGSARGPEELPWRVRGMRWLSRVLPVVPFGLSRTAAGMSAHAGSWTMGPASGEVLRQFAKADAEFVRWACGAVLGWEAGPALAMSVHQIHGACDRIIPVTRTRADVVVPGAGHLLSLTHAEAVNQFLRDRL